jgi:hypothetical protein
LCSAKANEGKKVAYVNDLRGSGMRLKAFPATGQVVAFASRFP